MMRSPCWGIPSTVCIRRLEQTYKSLYETELTLKEAQNMALQAQINPHFLYNTLETIDALSVCERMEDIGTVVQALSKVFRYALGEETSVTLREELGHVNDYLKILGIRYENKFTWETDVEEELLSLQLPQDHFPAPGRKCDHSWYFEKERYI